VGTRFRGWPEQAYPVLLKLGGEPSRETRERVRRHREEHVRQPMIDLLSDLADTDPWYEDLAVWRYASTAYWWQNQCAVIRVARNIEIGFRFNLDGLRIKAAWWQQAAIRMSVTGRVRVVVIDSRGGRVLCGGKRQMVDDTEWQWVTESVSGDWPRGSGHVRAAAAAAVRWLHGLEAWNEAVCGGAWASASHGPGSGSGVPPTWSTGRRSGSRSPILRSS
jgi:hypothetical protein